MSTNQVRYLYIFSFTTEPPDYQVTVEPTQATVPFKDEVVHTVTITNQCKRQEKFEISLKIIQQSELVLEGPEQTIFDIPAGSSAQTTFKVKYEECGCEFSGEPLVIDVIVIMPEYPSINEQWA